MQTAEAARNAKTARVDRLELSSCNPSVPIQTVSSMSGSINITSTTENASHNRKCKSLRRLPVSL
jgi:hypothetical protein